MGHCPQPEGIPRHYLLHDSHNLTRDAPGVEALAFSSLVRCCHRAGFAPNKGVSRTGQPGYRGGDPHFPMATESGVRSPVREDFCPVVEKHSC